MPQSGRTGGDGQGGNQFGGDEHERAALEMLGEREEWGIDALPDVVDLDMLRCLDEHGWIEARFVTMWHTARNPGNPWTPAPSDWYSPLQCPTMAGPWETLFRKRTRDERTHPAEVRVSERGRVELARMRRAGLVVRSEQVNREFNCDAYRAIGREIAALVRARPALFADAAAWLASGEVPDADATEHFGPDCLRINSKWREVGGLFAGRNENDRFYDLKQSTVRRVCLLTALTFDPDCDGTPLGITLPLNTEDGKDGRAWAWSFLTCRIDSHGARRHALVGLIDESWKLLREDLERPSPASVPVAEPKTDRETADRGLTVEHIRAWFQGKPEARAWMRDMLKEGVRVGLTDDSFVTDAGDANAVRALTPEVRLLIACDVVAGAHDDGYVDPIWERLLGEWGTHTDDADVLEARTYDAAAAVSALRARALGAVELRRYFALVQRAWEDRAQRGGLINGEINGGPSERASPSSGAELTNQDFTLGERLVWRALENQALEPPALAKAVNTSNGTLKQHIYDSGSCVTVTFG